MVAKEKQNSKLSFNQTIENRNTSSIEYNDLKKCTELTEDDEESNKFENNSTLMSKNEILRNSKLSHRPTSTNTNNLPSAYNQITS
jgi:hypothetical protein